MKDFLLGTCLLMFATVLPAQAASVDMQPGMWEWSMALEMPGMPMAMPPTVYSHCLSRDDLVPRQPERGSECETVKSSVSGNRVSWKVECRGAAGVSVSEGVMSYNGTTASGQVTTSTQGMVMKSTMSGRRTGNCK